MKQGHLVAGAVALCLLAGTLGYALVPSLADPDIALPWAAAGPSALAPAHAERPGDEAKAALVEVVDVLHVDLLEKVAGSLHATEGALVASSGGAEVKTLYLHSLAPTGTGDAAHEAVGTGPGPTMDETAPSDAASKTTAVGPGNRNFRKNFLLPYWAGHVHGTVTDITATLYLQNTGTAQVEVTLFGDGGIGVSSPAARRTVAVPLGGPQPVTVDFPGAQLRVSEELVLSVGAVGGSGAMSAFYDSTMHPASLTFTLSPLDGGPGLDDPAGLAFRAGKTLVANAGAGTVLELDGAAEPVVVAEGYYPAGFTRGLGGIATDAAGNAYFTDTETGRIHFLTPTGATGVYVDGMGAPTGLAFDAAGNLFVADSGAGRVLKVAPDRTVTTVATLPRGAFDLAFAPNGTLTVSTFRLGQLWNVDVATGDAYPLATLGGNATTEGLAYDAAGNLWLGSSLANATGRLLRLAPDLTLSLVDGTLGGPIRLAFVPGQSALAVATQGELTTLGDAVLTFATPDPGLPLAAPSLAPTGIAAFDGWTHRSGGRAFPSADYAGLLPTGAVRDVGRDPSEPTLGIQSDGTLFTVAASSAESMLRNPVVTGAGEPAVMRSRDNGATWQIVSPTLAGINDPPATADPFIHVDTDTDRVFTYDLTGACAYLSYSDDAGETWTTNRLACGNPMVDHQSLVTAKPRTVATQGYPNVVYHCTNWVLVSPCGRSLDGGDTWGPAGIAYVGAFQPGVGCPNSGGLMGHLGADLEGRVLVGKPLCGRPYAAISEDDGTTWRLVELNRTVGIRGHEIDFAADGANNLYATWIGADGQPYYVASTDHGATWSPARAVAPTRLAEAQMPSIAAGDDGRVAFSYIGTSTEYGYASQNAGKSAWNGYITFTMDALAADPEFVTITPHALQDPITRGACSRPCGGIWDFLDVRVGPDGRVWATFADSCTGACSAERTAPPAQFGNEVLGTFATGPRLRGSGALDAL